jgi:hypothetical protein
MENPVPVRAEPEAVTFSGFPPLYEDESIWSGCARYAERMGLTSTGGFMRELFGVGGKAWATDLPVGMSWLQKALPSGYPETADGLINRHTAYRYYAPFLPGDRGGRLREVIETGGKKFRQLLACRRISLNLPEYLRYCPSCAAEERLRLGECYWHCLHQLPGVEVCPTHEVWLESTRVFAWCVGDERPLMTAERVVPQGAPRMVSERDPERHTLLWMARESAWLLTHSCPSKGCESFPRAYRHLLAERGWGTYRKRLAWAPFWKAFVTSCPLSLLTRLEGHSKSLSSGNGIRALLRYPNRATPPLFHLLLIRFLGLTVEEFLQLRPDIEGFGTGPWPCLNPVAPHVNERAVIQCDVRIRRQDGRPIGTFSCGCGFVYQRVGPDWGPLAQYSYHRVVTYGLFWEWTLRTRWRDRRVTREILAEQLGVSRVTLWEQAVRQGIIGPTRSPREGTRWNRVSSVQPKDREQKRLQWQQLAQRRPRTLAQERRRQRLYAWLFRWDGAWLQAHQRRLREPGGDRDWAPRLDWSARDRQMAEAITRTQALLNAHQCPPQWISRRRLITHSGHARWIAPHLERLPQTRQAIQLAAETRQAFQLRRAAWRERRGREAGVLEFEPCARCHSVPSACGQQELFDAEGGEW